MQVRVFSLLVHIIQTRERPAFSITENPDKSNYLFSSKKTLIYFLILLWLVFFVTFTSDANLDIVSAFNAINVYTM